MIYLKIEGTNLYMIRGDTESISISCKKEGESYLDNGDTLYFTVKKSTKTKDILLQKIIKAFTEDNRAIIEIEPSDTKNLEFGSYRYDIQLTKFNGEVKTIVIPSNFVIEGEVTYD